MATNHAKLLIVDDDLPVRTSLSHIFASQGYAVRQAQDGFSALALMRLEAPDILLSDLNMPGMSGFELLSVVRRRFPMIRVIAMTGAFSVDGPVAGLAADAFYQKASSLPYLLQLVKQATPEVTRDTAQSGEGMMPDRGTKRAPVWIPRNGNASDGVEFVRITCPDCLRNFAQPIDRFGGLVREAICAHCQAVIPYAIVPAPDTTLSFAM